VLTKQQRLILFEQLSNQSQSKKLESKYELGSKLPSSKILNYLCHYIE